MLYDKYNAANERATLSMEGTSYYKECATEVCQMESNLYASKTGVNLQLVNLNCVTHVTHRRSPASWSITVGDNSRQRVRVLQLAVCKSQIYKI